MREKFMTGGGGKTDTSEDDMPANLRPFIEVLLEGAYEISVGHTPPISLRNVNEHQSKE